MYEYDDLAGILGFVWFSLQDESFSIMTGPPWFEGGDYLESRLAELNGELAMYHLGPNYERIEILMCHDAQVNNPPRCEQRHAFDFAGSVHMMATFDGGMVPRQIIISLESNS